MTETQIKLFDIFTDLTEKRGKKDPALFKVWADQSGLQVMTQPWGKPTRLTWQQAQSFAGKQLHLKFDRRPAVSMESIEGKRRAG